MAVGATEMEVCDVLDCCIGTDVAQLRRALAHYGVTYERRMQRPTKADPLCLRFPRAILWTTMRRKPEAIDNPHCMLSWDGKIYDPGGWWPGCARGSRITSALVLTGREGLRW